MVLYPKQQLDAAFRAIKTASLKGGATVLLLVATTTDSVCACRILTQLFQQEQITYKIKPISSHTDLVNVNQTDVRHNDDLSSIVLINCGAALPLPEIFPLKSHEAVCWVMDSHRPINLKNIHADSQYRIFQDMGEIDLVEIPQVVLDHKGLKTVKEDIIAEKERLVRIKTLLPPAKKEMQAMVRKHERANSQRDKMTAFPRSSWRDYFVYLRDKVGVEYEDGSKLNVENEMKKVDNDGLGAARDELLYGRDGALRDNEEEMGDEEEEFRPDLNNNNANASTPGGLLTNSNNSMDGGSRKRKRSFDSEESDDDEGLDNTRTITTTTTTTTTTNNNDNNDNPQFDENDNDNVGETQDDLTIPDTPIQSNSPNRKRGKIAANRLKYLNQLDKVYEDYYSKGTAYGVPSSAIMYKLSQDLNRSSNDLLWLALVAITDHYVKDYMDHNTYSSIVQVYRQEVLSKNSDGPRYYVEEETIDDVTQQVKVPISDDGRIEFTEEYRFMLHRHWSLYDAMYFSRFVSSRLGIWKMDGKDKLDTFLARMGVSLKESKQKFSFMSNDLKDRLREKIDEYATDYGLEDIVYGSFIRYVGFGHKFSAADYAFAITAALEVGNGLNSRLTSLHNLGKMINSNNNSSNNNSNSNSPGENNRNSSSSSNSNNNSSMIVGANNTNITTMNSNDDENRSMFLKKIQEIERRRTEDRFNAAYKVISGKKLESLERVTTLSMEIQRATVRQGIAIVEQKKLVNAGKFRYAFIETMSHGDLQYFLKPTLVAKLGLWLVEAAREAGKRRGRGKLPIVLCVLNEMKGMYTCVGIPSPRQFGEIESNLFPRAFKEAAENVSVKYQHDSFDTSCIEIAKDDVQRFTESLYLTLDEMGIEA